MRISNFIEDTFEYSNTLKFAAILLEMIRNLVFVINFVKNSQS